MTARSRISKLEARRREAERKPLNIFVQSDDFNLDEYLRKNGLPSPCPGTVSIWRWGSHESAR